MDDNFEDNIRKALDQSPEIPFNPQAWERMQKRLQPSKTSSSNWKIILPIAFLSLLLLLGGTYFSKYSIAAERILLLEDELRLERMHSSTGFAKDTLTERHHVVIYDTTYVYTTKKIQIADSGYATEFAQRKISNKNNTTSTITQSPAFSFPTDRQNAFLSNSKLNNTPSFLYFNQNSNRNTAEHSANKRLALQEALSITNKKASLGTFNNSTTLLSVSSIRNPLFTNDNNINATSLSVIDKQKQKKGLGYYLSYIQPANYSLGLYAGTSRETSIQVPDPIFETNYTIGVRGEIHYSSGFSIMLGAEYFENIYEAEAEIDGEDTELYTAGYPEIPATFPEDKFHEIILNFEYFQIPIAVQYRFLSNKNFHPYLGLGIISRKALTSEIEIEYTGNSGIYSVYNNKVITDDFKVNTAFGYLGLEFDLTKHWRLHFEARSEFDVGKKGEFNYDKVQFLRFTSGLQYAF